MENLQPKNMPKIIHKFKITPTDYAKNTPLKNYKRLTLNQRLKKRLQYGVMYQHPFVYDAVIWMTDPTELVFKNIAREIVGVTVLDLGCGTGKQVEYLPKGVKYIGLDLNERFISFAKKNRNGKFFKKDILGDLSEFTADTVILSDVLHHVTPHHQKLIKQALKIANSKVLISACYEQEENPLKNISEFICRRIIDNDGLNHQREGAGWLSKREVLSFLRKNGAENFKQVVDHVFCEIITG
ncbi:MAG: methyltransferase domain-containing protein [Asgard group archaeon]|nr:methyltransferase domain-containing protein [Asgard group archaeon]